MEWFDPKLIFQTTYINAEKIVLALLVSSDSSKLQIALDLPQNYKKGWGQEFSV